MKGFSIIIPVYNEEDLLIKNTQLLISYLNRYYTNFEIIIGSNGSTDSTYRLGMQLKERYPFLHFFHLHQKGVGRVFREAVKRCRYDYIISLDMDLSVELSFINEALHHLKNGYAIVVGSKRLGNQKRSVFRLMGSGLFILCARALLDLPFKDYSIGAKGYKKDIIIENMNLVDNGTSYVINIISMAYRRGYDIIEIPIICEDRRESRFNIIEEGIYRFWKLFGLWLYTKRYHI